MTIDPLDRQLRELPVIRASDGFTERVLDRLEEPAASPEPARPARVVWVAVGASAALLAVLALLPERRPRAAPELAAEATEIRRQHALLSEELDRLRSRTEEAAPILYLGSDDEIDYVLDLSPFLLPHAGGIMPASSNNPTTSF